MGCRCRRDEVGWLGGGRGRGSGQRAAGAVCGTLVATPETRHATSRENENEDCAGDQDNRSVGQKMSDAARQVVGPLEEWADGGVAGNLEEFCWVFWDDERIWRLSETRKRNGLLVPLWPSGPSPRATDRDPEPVCAPPTSSQPAADCCLRQPSGPAVWAARTHRPSQAGARHMKSRTGLAIWFALHPIKRVFPVSARRCLGFSTTRRADGKLDNTHISLRLENPWIWISATVTPLSSLHPWTFQTVDFLSTRDFGNDAQPWPCCNWCPTTTRPRPPVHLHRLQGPPRRESVSRKICQRHRSGKGLPTARPNWWHR